MLTEEKQAEHIVTVQTAYAGSKTVQRGVSSEERVRLK